MALIDVDRHILSALATLSKLINEGLKKFLVAWGVIIEVRDKTDALLFHSIPSTRRDEQLKQLKDKIYKASIEINEIFNELSVNFSKQEALLAHLVTVVHEIDTGEGTETLQIDKKEGEVK